MFTPDLSGHFLAYKAEKKLWSVDHKSAMYGEVGYLLQRLDAQLQSTGRDVLLLSIDITGSAAKQACQELHFGLYACTAVLVLQLVTI